MSKTYFILLALYTSSISITLTIRNAIFARFRVTIRVTDEYLTYWRTFVDITYTLVTNSRFSVLETVTSKKFTFYVETLYVNVIDG